MSFAQAYIILILGDFMLSVFESVFDLSVYEKNTVSFFPKLNLFCR